MSVSTNVEGSQGVDKPDCPFGQRARNLTVMGAANSYRAPCSAIHRRTSSARHAVTRADNLTGPGKVPAWMRRHRVDREIGTNSSTCGWHRKPVSSRRVGVFDRSDETPGDPCGGWDAVVVTASVYLRMIEPRYGNGRQQT